MANFNEMMQEFVNRDYEELVKIASVAVAEVLPACRKADPSHDGYVLLAGILLAALNADGTLTDLERKFLYDVLDFDDETISNMLSLYDDSVMELTDTFADNMGDDNKSNVIILCLCICAVDEKISREETAFLRKLLA